MLVSGLTTATDMTDPPAPADKGHGPGTELPLDYLVKALDRAIERGHAPGSRETEHRT